MANKENTSDEGLRVSYDVKTYHEQKYIDYTLRLSVQYFLYSL